MRTILGGTMMVQPSPSEGTDAEQESSSVLFRPQIVLLCGLPFSLLSAWTILRMEQPENYATPTGLTLYYPVVVLFGLSLLLNRGLARLFGPRWSLGRSELLCVYTLMGLSCAYVCW